MTSRLRNQQSHTLPCEFLTPTPCRIQIGQQKRYEERQDNLELELEPKQDNKKKKKIEQ